MKSVSLYSGMQREGCINRASVVFVRFWMPICRVQPPSTRHSTGIHQISRSSESPGLKANFEIYLSVLICKYLIKDYGPGVPDGFEEILRKEMLYSQAGNKRQKLYTHNF